MRMSGMWTSRRMSCSCSKRRRRDMPFRRARVAAFWMTMPSAIGSLNGMPISIMLTPFFSRVRITSAVPSRFGQPAQKYMDSRFLGLSWKSGWMRFTIVVYDFMILQFYDFMMYRLRLVLFVIFICESDSGRKRYIVKSNFLSVLSERFRYALCLLCPAPFRSGC